MSASLRKRRIAVVLGLGALSALGLVAALRPRMVDPPRVPPDVASIDLGDAFTDAGAPDAADASTRAEHYIDFLDPDASDGFASIKLPGWPGWPLPRGTTVTPTIFCQGTFGARLFVRDTKCSVAESLADQERNKHGFEAFGAGMDRAATSRCIRRVTASVEKGRVELDPEAGERCITAAIRDAFGDQRATIESSECNGYLIGKATKGESCREPWECVDGLACVGYTSKADGLCKDPPPVGARCGNGAPERNMPTDLGLRLECAIGAHCPALGGTCMAQRPKGRRCAEEGECADGLACRAKKCVPKDDAGAGDACLNQQECPPGLFCEGTDYMNEAGRCAPKKSAGQECHDDSDCKGRCQYDDTTRRRRCISWCQSG